MDATFRLVMLAHEFMKHAGHRTRPTRNMVMRLWTCDTCDGGLLITDRSLYELAR